MIRNAIETFDWQSKITGIHLHHSVSPGHKHWKRSGSDAVVEAIRRAHVNGRGWSDIGYHALVMPDGSVHKGRDWNRAPASALAHNGTGAAHPFAICMIGDLRPGFDPVLASQMEGTALTIAALDDHFPELDIKAHRDLQATECPGLTDDQIDSLIATAKTISMFGWILPDEMWS